MRLFITLLMDLICLSHADTSKIVSTCWIRNPIDVGLEEFRFNLLINYLFNSFLALSFCANEIRSPMAAIFSVWSSCTG